MLGGKGINELLKEAVRVYLRREEEKTKARLCQRQRQRPGRLSGQTGIGQARISQVKGKPQTEGDRKKPVVPHGPTLGTLEGAGSVITVERAGISKETVKSYPWMRQ